MPLRDLLRLADQALAGHTGPQLAEEALRHVLEETSARAGVLRRGDEAVARWPRTATRQVENATAGWTDLPFQAGEASWSLRLLQMGRLDDAVVEAIRLLARAWELREELKRARFDERFHLWELEAIRSIATSIGGILDSSRLAEELISHLVALLGVRSAQLYLGAGADQARLEAGFGEPAVGLDELREVWGQGLYRDEVVALSLSSDGGVLGMLVAAHKEARAGGTEPFAANDLRLLELFGVQVTVAMEYARLTRESLERERLRRELEVAAEIQSHLHPQEAPEFPGFRLVARSTPSRQVAGDTYDVLVHQQRMLASVTDVSGKGVGAGMIASGVHACIRLLADQRPSLDMLADRVNAYLVGATESNRFATFAMVRLHADGEMQAVNAGHLPILIRRRDGRIEHLPSSGLPLGILDSATYEEVTTRVEPGDLVVLYTDGLTEAENPDEEEFGYERVEEVVASLAVPTAEEAAREILSRVDEHVCGRPLADDATLLVIERLFEGQP